MIKRDKDLNFSYMEMSVYMYHINLNIRTGFLRSNSEVPAF